MEAKNNKNRSFVFVSFLTLFWHKTFECLIVTYINHIGLFGKLLLTNITKRTYQTLWNKKLSRPLHFSAIIHQSAISISIVYNWWAVNHVSLATWTFLTGMFKKFTAFLQIQFRILWQCQISNTWHELMMSRSSNGDPRLKWQRCIWYERSVQSDLC